MWLLFSILSAVTAALMTIAAKIGLKNIDPTLATGIRSVIMCLFMILVVIFTDKMRGLAHVDRRAFVIIAISAIFGALSWLFYFLALRSGITSKVAAIDRLSLIFVIVFSIFALSEKTSWKLVTGGILATVGITLIALA